MYNIVEKTDPDGRQRDGLTVPSAEPSQDTQGDLRRRIEFLERPALAKAAPGVALSLGIAEIDGALPGGGLALASVHEVCGASSLTPALGFSAALLGRAAGRTGTVLWCRRSGELYAPGLTAFGLRPDNLIVVQAKSDKDILWTMEEGLRSGALSAVLGEPGTISPIALRRLQLAAETGGTMGLLLGLEKHQTVSASAMTRWRVETAESRHPLGPWPGVSSWQVDLMRCRNGARGSWRVEWRDGYANDNPQTGGPDSDSKAGHFALVEPLRHGPHQTPRSHAGGADFELTRLAV
ncbi:MAG: hypothetical protein HOB37_16350 [Rhodospirillaceae bacterium]|nr:hypothetical protein [Rhodospirillaceae bacterium]MBT6610007.1 hypothetical protein [Rhodospirillaceae bacterium]MBT7248886.1 hypothetical protein [Rhodospirillaceae bacterium]